MKNGAANTQITVKQIFRRFFLDYGIIFVLLLLGVYYSFATLQEQFPAGKEAAKPVVKKAIREGGADARFLIVTGTGHDETEYAREVNTLLQQAGIAYIEKIHGGPPAVKKALQTLHDQQSKIDVIIVSQTASTWKFLRPFGESFPSFSQTTMVQPEAYWFPDFLKRSNMLAIANRIVVIAIIAIGMTMVIITTGIDLSVGSLIALSAVVWTLFIRDYAGAEHASAFGMLAAAFGALAMCALSGLFSGLMVTQFMIPPFIVTLAMMMVASGLAFTFAEGQSIYQVPDSITWLGRGTGILGIPNAVLLMAFLYFAAHILMTRTIVGRYIYAVGGNKEAARLSGVPVNSVLFFVYATSGALAGLGGIIQASQLKSGAATYGDGYELYVIAAVVVGGTSLSGGEGKILGTLIGAFIIAVIQNGMNLTGVESYTQKVVLGLVILGAVLLDMLKKRGSSFKILLKLAERFKSFK